MTTFSGDTASALETRIEELFLAHVDAVFNVAHRVLWNRADAEDVVQATFVKAFTRLGQLNNADRVRPWLLQVGYREAISVLRRRRDIPVDPHDAPEHASQAPGPEQRAVLSSIADELSRALEDLNRDERMAVVLRDVEELSMREVAEVLGIGVSAAKMRVHRGRQSLRISLERRNISDAL